MYEHFVCDKTTTVSSANKENRKILELFIISLT